MQPTIIKIKFTPIIRHLQKDNTKCCLEIVPDVSCIQNLDTIEWNDENKLVEYSVPVTYKIILKRDIDSKDVIEKRDKMYYSCIDLRLLSTDSTLACGDIAKVTSDNYILRKVITEFESRDFVSEESRRQNDNKKNISDEDKEFTNIAKEINKSHLSPLGDENETVQNDVDLSSSQRYIHSVNDKKSIREICTECTVSKETITDISDVKSNQQKKRQLTITSVCTLNTIDNPVNSTVYDGAKQENSKICLKYKSKNKIESQKSTVNEAFAVHRHFYAENKKLRIKNTSRERVLPELRVAHFMTTVENEILPLKILLGDIYKKCVSLGLLWNSNIMPESTPVIYTKHTDKMKILPYSETKPKCNRVVYSIVFEE